jgi:DNA-binding NarL/FixJ family response regulator
MRRFDAAAARRGAHAEPVSESVVRPAEPGSLTPRELEVLELAAAGLTNREIGQRLILAEDTVKSVVKKLLARLGAASRAHAVAIGFRTGLLR